MWIKSSISKIKDPIALTKKLTLGCLISIFTFQSSVITALVTVFDCQDIQSKSYIREYLLESCNDDRYLTFYYFLALPVFLVFAIFLPLGLFLYMFYKRRNICSKEVMNRIGFLINGYKTSYYYWEFIFFFKKLIIIYLVIYYNSDVLKKSLILLMFFMVCLLIQTECHPFMTKNLNTLQFNESITIVFILASATLSSLATNDIIKIFCSLAILILNCQFVFFSLKEILIYKINSIKKIKYLAWLAPMFNLILKSKLL